MDPELKAKWVKALRSGRYKQGIGVLRRKNNTYCCLGVLYEVVKGKNAWTLLEILSAFETHDSHTTMPSPTFLGEVGLQVKEADYLAELNDEGKTFEEIADAIEYQA